LKKNHREPENKLFSLFLKKKGGVKEQRGKTAKKSRGWREGKE